MHYHSARLSMFRIVPAFHTAPFVTARLTRAHTQCAARHERMHKVAAHRLPLPHSQGDQLPVKNVPSSFLRLCTIATSSLASWRSSLRYAGNHCLVALFFFGSLVTSVCAVAPWHGIQWVDDSDKQGSGSMSSHRFLALWRVTARAVTGAAGGGHCKPMRTHRLAGGLVLDLLLHRHEKCLRVLLPPPVRHDN